MNYDNSKFTRGKKIEIIGDLQESGLYKLIFLTFKKLDDILYFIILDNTYCSLMILRILNF